MGTPVELFNYDLPESMIAQKSVEPRDHSRLMVLDRESGTIEHRTFFEIVDLLRAGDVLVFNNTKVFKARLIGVTDVSPQANKSVIELFLLREREGKWEAMARPGKKLSVGDVIDVGIKGKITEKKEDGTVMIDFGMSPSEVLAFCDAHGEVPIPPYVVKSEQATGNYQTVYAREVGAVAAPTAGFHFTERLLDALRVKGVQIEFITLHVGIGTFRPVKTATLEEHVMHAEFVQIDAQTSERILLAKKEGRRVIAVGTTVVRALEATGGEPTMGDVNIFIMPGYTFKVIDGLITNFHLPKSTLLALVSAFAGRDHVMAAYEVAKKEGYRFYSFGDAMFIA